MNSVPSTWLSPCPQLDAKLSIVRLQEVDFMPDSEHPPTTSRAVWIACRSPHDKQAWCQLDASYRPGLVGFANKLLHREPNNIEGEEIACEVLARLFLNNCRLLHAFKPEKATFEVYLRMLVRSAIRHRRRRPCRDDFMERLDDDEILIQLDELPFVLHLEEIRRTLTRGQQKLLSKCLEEPPDDSKERAADRAERQMLRRLRVRISEHIDMVLRCEQNTQDDPHPGNA